MSFDTLTFWLFFAFAWTGWRTLPFPLAKSFALVSSLLFYAWWNPWFLGLIAISAGVDSVAGARIWAARQAGDERGTQLWLGLSLFVNLGLLAVFKYWGFAVETTTALLESMGFGVSRRVLSWVIPVGISFYTFQSLSYSLDIYRGRIQPARSFRDFFLFVAFFPQLVAGPIVRASEFLPQLRHRRRLRLPVLSAGLYFVISGLFLKVVIADNLAPVVNEIFAPGAIGELSPVRAWLGAIYFGTQILADFAGYSGIAIGLAYCMGLRFPRNFLYPYISRGLSEFWTRWHITLSQWLRDYLYISLGGNRHGRRRMYAALMLTMLIGGLWHGAAWTFVVWGGLHGLGLCLERVLTGAARPRGPSGPPAHLGEVCQRLLQIALVFVFVHTTWVFFRAQSLEMAWQYLERMYVEPFRGPLGLEDLLQARHLLLLLPVAALHVGQLLHEWYGLRKTAVRRALLAGIFLFLLTVVRRGEISEFIYFQF